MFRNLNQKDLVCGVGTILIAAYLLRRMVTGANEATNAISGAQVKPSEENAESLAEERPEVQDAQNEPEYEQVSEETDEPCGVVTELPEDRPQAQDDENGKPLHVLFFVADPKTISTVLKSGGRVAYLSAPPTCHLYCYSIAS